VKDAREARISILRFLHVNVIWNYATYTTIHSRYDDLSKSNFWRITYNATLDIAVIDWCKLFGAYGEKTHFKNCKEERGIDNFAAQVLSVCKITENDYKALHTSIVDFRNKAAAHVDLDDWRINIPYLNKAVEVTYASFDVFTQNCGLKGWDLRNEFDVQSLSTAMAIDRFTNLTH
jgi:hypothetical protein